LVKLHFYIPDDVELYYTTDGGAVAVVVMTSIPSLFGILMVRHEHVQKRLTLDRSRSIFEYNNLRIMA